MQQDYGHSHAQQCLLSRSHILQALENEKLRSMIEVEMEVYLTQIKDLTAQGGNSGPHGAKLNYCHGRYEGLQWVLSKINE